MTQDEYNAMMLRNNVSLSTNNSHIPESAFNIDSIPSIFDVKSDPLEWAVPDVITFSAITMISGESGSGKSSFVAWLCHNLSNGLNGLTKRRVLYLDGENSLPILKERFKRLGITDGPDFKYLGLHSFGGTMLQPWSQEIVQWVRNNYHCVVVIDSFRYFLQGKEN